MGKMIPEVERRRVRIEDLKPAPYNPRRMSEESLAGLAAGIERWGLVQEIVWNKRTGHVVGGHQRLKVLLAEGVEDVPVAVVDLDDAEERALNLALNNPAIQGVFTEDVHAMAAEACKALGDIAKEIKLDALKDIKIEMPKVEPQEGQTDPDAIPEEVEPDSEKGVIYQLGEHRVLCGDCREKEGVQQLMEGKTADAVLTDPPYGVNYQYESWGDDDKEVNNSLFEGIQGSVPVVYFCGSINLLREMHRGPCKILIWHKPWSTTHSGIGNGRHHWEPIIVRNLSKTAYLATDVIVQNTDRIPGLRNEHSCPKPVELLCHLIQGLLKEGIVYDPFLGSGTTVIACEKLGRRCYGIEIEPKYVDVIRKRWAEFVHGEGCEWKALTPPLEE